MCGIFGAVSVTGAPLKHPECIAQMAARLRPGGRAGERTAGHERARLGARRLAIMDLTTGDQPFQSADGAVWMVCNGEIYNARELRTQATGWGYPFRSHGDIENIVPFYERYGRDAVGRLEGMFGLAIWDDRRQALILARDRAGEKPLFWTTVDGELRFASEIQALLAYPDQLRRLDSSLLAAAAARVKAGEQIHTYSVKFVERGYDESVFAEAVTHHIRTMHHVVTADDESLGHALEVVTRTLAEPVGDPAILPTYLLADAARAHVKVVLSGEGADELFGGYPTYPGHQAARAYLRLPRLLRRAATALVNRWPTSTGKVTLEFLLKQLVAAAELPALERHLTWFGALGPDTGIVRALACLLAGVPPP